MAEEVRQAVVDRITRHLVPRVVADEPAAQERIDRNPITLLWQGSGIVEVRQNSVMRCVTAIAEGKTPYLPDLTSPGVMLKMPKIPFARLREIVSFFRAVEKEHKAEAFVQLAWDGAEYYVSVPPQVVSGAHVEHKGPVIPEAHVLIADVHSHGGSMGAFWSGTDDKDEQQHPLRAFGVIGKVMQAIPESRWRVWSGTGFHDLTLNQVFDCDGEMTVKMSALSIITGRPIDPFGTVVPDAWMAQVSTRSVVTAFEYGGYTHFKRDFPDDDKPLWGMSNEEYQALRNPQRDASGYITGKGRKTRKRRSRPSWWQTTDREEDATGLFPSPPREGQRVYRSGRWWQYVAGGWRPDTETEN